MHRRFLASCLRFAARELASETSSADALSKRGLSTAIVGSRTTRLFGFSGGDTTAKFVPEEILPSCLARWQSNDVAWNSVLYPDSELEVGSPAPDFVSQGTGPMLNAR